MTSSPTAAGDIELEARARRRVGLKLVFLAHAALFVLVNTALFFIDSGNGGPRWSQYPLAGWGLGLALHAVATTLALRGDAWRERLVAHERQRLKQHG